VELASIVARARRASARVRDAGLRRGVLPYRTQPWTPQEWRAGYDSGHLDYFAGIDELPRYSLLLGYLVFLGGEPEILDVGCGQGLFRARLAACPFRRYVGIDPVPAAIDQARALTDDRTEFVLGDVTDPGVALGEFDVVVCNEVLSVAPDVRAVLDRVRAVLRPGGHLLSSTWHHPGDQQLHALVDERFTLVDAVDAKNAANPIALDGWRVTCHRNE
jgi:2-polyprenyl-6-hydroxyphenyl methylase/3-demethylubiquinone-9 3-methyltransferase